MEIKTVATNNVAQNNLVTKKKKILLLSDDLRMHSGVGTVSRNIVKHTCHKYDWVQLGGAVKHPDVGKIIDISEDLRKESGVEHASCRIYPTHGYGNAEMLRDILKQENPDMIIHFTDPRFWGWLYSMEHELRQTMPLGYLNIWDDLPFPHWNEKFYDCCDLLMAISKQTYNINKHVCQLSPRTEGKDLFYVPHGINEKEFYPIDDNHAEYNEMQNFKAELLGDHMDAEMVFTFNSRNIRRKMVSDAMLAYRVFCDSLPKEEAEKCLFMLHTDPVDPNGTDLPAVARALCKKYRVGFSASKINSRQLNYFYNLSDCGINTSSAEGFGLSCMETIMSGTPVIVNTTGGLQDQCGFLKDGKLIKETDYSADWPSNSDGRYKECGEWAFPTFPQFNLQGSPQTPYIYDGRANVTDIAKQMMRVYKLGKEERQRRGMAGREWAINTGFTAKAMCEYFETAVDTCFETWTPRQKFDLINTNRPTPDYPDGILFNKIEEGETI
jgi:glycosyltransferase involved in cell wall biosynthesis|tara:strand:- start:1638 stop:3128 length:1491 start_codon:yes stop_codon:yes gene_type:complete